MPDLVHPEDGLADYEFCSKTCQDISFNLLLDARGQHDMAKLTQMEMTAIKDARASLADVLDKLGLMPAFFDRSPEDIDKIITACVHGFRMSMQKQSTLGEIPF